MLWHHRTYVSFRALTPGADDIPMRLMCLRSLLAGLVSIFPPPSLCFHPVWLGPTPSLYVTIAPRRTVPSPPPFVCSDVIFLFEGEERDKTGTLFLVFPFRLYVS